MSAIFREHRSGSSGVYSDQVFSGGSASVAVTESQEIVAASAIGYITGAVAFVSVVENPDQVVGAASAPSGSSATAAEIWAYEIEPGVTAAAAMRRILAMLCGNVSGAGTDTEVFRDVNDTRNAVTVTVDASGNRGPVTFDDGP